MLKNATKALQLGPANCRESRKLPRTRQKSVQKAVLLWHHIQNMYEHSLGMGLIGLFCVAALGAASIGENWERQLDVGRQQAGRGQYAEARRAFQKAREDAEQFGPDDPRLAIAWNNLGVINLRLNLLGDAEQCYRRSAAIWESRGDTVKALAPLTNLAEVYLARKQFSPAEKLLRHALELSTEKLGPEHAQTAAILTYLSDSALHQRDFAAAASLSERALAVLRKIHTPPDPELAVAVDNLGTMYRALGRRQDSDRMYIEAAEILEQSKQPEHPAWIRAWADLSYVYGDQGKYGEAEALLKRSLALGEKALGPSHPMLARVLTEYAALLRRTKHKSEAKKLEARATVILAQSGRDNSLGYTVDVRGMSSFR
jgi:tetratricopeptide (TPR) repeat protein